MCAGMYVWMQSLCVGMGVWMNHCVLYGCVDESVCVGMYVNVGVEESLCVGMGVWMNHCVLVWVCG